MSPETELLLFAATRTTRPRTGRASHRQRSNCGRCFLDSTSSIKASRAVDSKANDQSIAIGDTKPDLTIPIDLPQKSDYRVHARSNAARPNGKKHEFFLPSKATSTGQSNQSASLFWTVASRGSLNLNMAKSRSDIGMSHLHLIAALSTGYGSLKWDKYKGRDILPLWVADMDFVTAPKFSRTQQRLDHGIFGYTIPHEVPIEAVIKYLDRQHGHSAARLLAQLPGLVPAINLCCHAFTEPETP